MSDKKIQQYSIDQRFYHAQTNIIKISNDSDELNTINQWVLNDELNEQYNQQFNNNSNNNNSKLYYFWSCLCDEVMNLGDEIKKMNLFNVKRNDLLREYPITDLKYLLIYWYIAICQKEKRNRKGMINNERVPPNERINDLNEVLKYLDQFLLYCDSLSILTNDQIDQWEVLENNKEDNNENTPIIRTESREEKIAKYKRKREFEKKIEELNKIMSNISTNDENNNDIKMDIEENERERIESMINLSIIECFEEIEMINREKDMLKQMASIMSKNNNELPIPNPPPRSNEGMEITKIVKVNGELIQTRETIRSKVFKEHIEPWTLTPEQAAELDLKEMKEREEEKKRNPPPEHIRRYDQLVKDGDEDNLDLVDKAVYKDRDWDNWKDEHPKGMGNKANKII